MSKKKYDLIIKNLKVVKPESENVEEKDIAIKDGKFAAIETNIDPEHSNETYDGKGKLAFPGLVDAHMHTGIYNPLDKDAVIESRAAAMGGVTSSLNYMRTGGYYLNKGGPYRDFMPEVFELSNDNFYVDYAYHLAPMDKKHISEIPELIEEFGVTSFKIFMFYGGHGLHGASSNQHEFLMINPEEKYDIAHFEFVMRGVQDAITRFPDKKDDISLSLHCETAEIMAAYTKMVQEENKLTGLRAYSASRPPHSEGLAIFIASYLANETELPNINLLHLTSKKAVDAAMQMQAVFPHINFRREVTIGHLILDVDADTGNLANNVIPAKAKAVVNIRFNDTFTSKQLGIWLKQEAERISTETDIEISVETKVSGESFLTPPGELSSLVGLAIKNELGITPEMSTTGGTSDARFVKNVCPVVEFGLVGKTMHSVDERVDISQIHHLKSIYTRILKDYFAS